MFNGIYNNVRIGCDPEVFIKKKDTGELFPIVGLLGGTKEAPLPVTGIDGFAVQEDNVMAEFNIPPAANKFEWVESLRVILGELRGRLPQFELAIQASAEFNPEHLTSKQASVVGCDPDYNAWTLKENPRPCVVGKNLRTAAGHIHIGYDDPTMASQVALVRAMDFFVGVPSVVLDPDKVRKTLYGKAGAHRPKPYGVEWRVASNFWLQTKELQEWAFDSTKRAVDWLNNGGELSEELGKEIQHLINSGDVRNARLFCRTHQLLA